MTRKPGYPTDAEAAQAWAKYRNLDLNEIRHARLGTVAVALGVLNAPNPPAPIPTYVLATIANLEQEQPA